MVLYLESERCYRGIFYRAISWMVNYPFKIARFKIRKASLEYQAYWRSVLYHQQKSDMNIWRFCTKNQLSEPSFYNWKKKIGNCDRQVVRSSKTNDQNRFQSKRVTKQSDKASVFIPVRLNAVAGRVLEVVHLRGHVVRVAAAIRQ